MAVDYPIVTKPSRSDEILDPNQQILVTEQIKAEIDSMVPKRPVKPSRSDPDSAPPPYGTPDLGGYIPELDKFLSLKSQSQIVLSTENGLDQEEFTETEYYKQLDSVDKQHHTTGTGFIKVVAEGYENASHIDLKDAHETNTVPPSYRSNPATNDWVPSLYDHQVDFVTSKPTRSG